MRGERVKEQIALLREIALRLDTEATVHRYSVDPDWHDEIRAEEREHEAAQVRVIMEEMERAADPNAPRCSECGQVEPANSVYRSPPVTTRGP